MRVLIISQSLLGAGIRTILERQVDWQIQYESTQDPSAVAELCQAYQPHVTLLDAVCLHVLELFQQLELPQVRLLGRMVVVTMEALDEETLFFLAKWGVSACIKTSIAPEDLVTVLRRVGNDEWLLSCDILETAAPRISRSPKNAGRASVPVSLKEPDDLAPDSPLSSQEADILSCIAQGQTNKEIAGTLGLHEQHVEHVCLPALFAKLGVDNRTAAVVYALRRRWIRMPGCPAEATAAVQVVA